MKYFIDYNDNGHNNYFPHLSLKFNMLNMKCKTVIVAYLLVKNKLLSLSCMNDIIMNKYFE